MTNRESTDAEQRDERVGSPRDDRRLSSADAPSDGEVPRSMFSAAEIYQRISATAVHEFQRTPRMLWFSGLAAGLSIGMCFLGRVVLGGPTGQAGEPLGDLLFPLGFVVVVLGRYQLFTENTLTPITLVLTRAASLPALARLWGVVLGANVVGAIVIGTVLATPGALPEAAVDAGVTIAEHIFETPLRVVFIRAVLAGGIVASMVWMVHAMRDSAGRVLVIYMLAYVMPLAGMFHCVTSLVEVVFGVMRDVGSISQAIGFFLATTAGNIVGGVVLVATINYGQTHDRRGDTDRRALSWREFFLGHQTGRSGGEAVAPELQQGRTTTPSE
jgi:formate/nitrite transporter FocA (FNT family)